MTALYLDKCTVHEKGIILVKSIFLLFSKINDSLTKNNPKRKFNNEKPAATKNGACTPQPSPTIPQIAGPITKPKPNAAPIIPKFFALSSFVLISAIYAVATV